MVRRGTRFLLGAMALLAVPCASTATATAACPPPNQQLVLRGELPPLIPPAGTLPLYTTAIGLTQSYHESPAKTQSDAQVLTANGFQSGSWEYLNGRHHTLKRAGLSSTNLLGSPQGAIQQMTADLAGPRARRKREGLRVRTVTVPGIPGSTGYTVQDKQRRYYPAANLAFTRGSYEYFVGEDGFNAHNLRDTRRAALALYNRAVVAGC